MTTMGQPDPAALLPEELVPIVESLGAPCYRASQIFRWIHRHGAADYDSMSNLPSDLRQRLAEELPLRPPVSVDETPPGSDGSRKILYRLADDTEVETVRIAGPDGVTVCVSSQSGCRYGCTFCATALGGLRRSLGAGEITGQITSLGEPVKRIVYMGMGEPLANYRNVTKSIRILIHPEGAAIPPRRITVSTVGLVPLIDRLAAEDLGIRLAISLTSADDAERAALMPIAKSYGLEALLAAAKRFALRAGDPVTFEYVLISSVNDTEEDARALARRLAPLPCKVNLIPFNPVDELPYEAPPEDRIDRFLAILAPRVTVTVRRSAGRSIDAACGQLRLRRGKGAAGRAKEKNR